MKSLTRSRVVTFRLSEQEYNFLKSACCSELDSVSAVARRTVLDWAALSAQPKMDERLSEMDEKLDALLGLLEDDRAADFKLN